MVRTTSGWTSNNVIISYIMYIINLTNIIHLTNIYMYLIQHLYGISWEIVIYTMIINMITNLYIKYNIYGLNMIYNL